jgi:hypothetical protein
VVFQDAAVHHHFEARLPRPPRGLLMVHPDRLRALAEGGLI